MYRRLQRPQYRPLVHVRPYTVDIKPQPLPLRTVVGLIIMSSTFSMSFYLTYQMFNFMNSEETNKSIFLPLCFNPNIYFRRSYDLSKLLFLDQDIQDSVEIDQLSKRIRFKIINYFVNSRPTELIDVHHITTIDDSFDYKFKLNSPAISGLEFTASKVASDNNDANNHPVAANGVTADGIAANDTTKVIASDNVRVNVGWCMKLLNMDPVFLINQPSINRSGTLDLIFSGNVSIHDGSRNSTIKVKGVVEHDNILFNEITIVLDKEYRIV